VTRSSSTSAAALKTRVAGSISVGVARRRPRISWQSPGGLAEDALRLRLQTIPVGVALTYATVVTLAAWVAATWSAPNRPLIAAMLGCAVVTASVIAALPHGRILRSAHRETFFLAWSLSYVAVITVMAAADGGARSPVTLVYFLTLVYASLSYPFRSVVVISVSSVLAFMGLAVLEAGPHTATAPSGAYVWVFASCLALVATMCIWQSQLNARHFARLGELSRADTLTGALNRLGFSERVEAELAAVERGGQPLSIVLLDLVGFKAVNDTLGHHAGDELLRWVARTMTQVVRPGDSVARLGGDEFAVLLPGTPPARALEVAERIRGALAERIQATLGVASAPHDAMDIEGLTRAADDRLYASRGRAVSR